MKKQWIMYLFIAAAVLWLSGCIIRQDDLADKMSRENAGQAGQETVSQDGRNTEEETKETGENHGEASPAFEGQDMEGNAVSSTVFSKAKLTMVNVWATYCNPCLKEMPGLGELAGEYAEDEFQLLGIISDVQEGDSQEMLDYAAELIEQTGAGYPHLLLNESIYRSLLTEVVAVPTTFFFNSKGELLDTVVGSMEKEEWKEKIDALLEK